MVDENRIKKGQLLTFAAPITLESVNDSRLVTFDTTKQALVVESEGQCIAGKYTHIYIVTVLYDNGLFKGSVAHIHSINDNVQLVV